MFRIELDYPPTSRNEPRYIVGRTNRYIDQVLEKHREAYITTLNSFSKYFATLKKIDVRCAENEGDPLYINDFLPGLDCISLYCLLAEIQPKTYVEVGSGNSTKFAKRSVRDNNLTTRIVSVDPHPRAEIDKLCDEVIREPLENLDLAIFDSLQAGDMVFVDGSHRAFMNSDVTVFFIDILPRLARGVYVHLHDIWWPVDYPGEWRDRYYNEQYLLGALLANGFPSYEIILPNFFISLNADLAKIVEQLWESDPELQDVQRHGCSFWMRRQ